MNLPSRFGLFVSALKIPFPGNRDFGSKRLGSNAWIIELEGRACGAGGTTPPAGEACNPHAVRESTRSWQRTAELRFGLRKGNTRESDLRKAEMLMFLARNEVISNPCSGPLDDLLRDHDLVDALEAW